MSDNDAPNPPTHQLTSDEVQLIQETWKIPNANVSSLPKLMRSFEDVYLVSFFLHVLLKAMDSAELIFYTFLERFPEHQQKFAAFKKKPLTELKGSPYFRAHASRIFNIFTCVVDGLGKDPNDEEVKKFIADGKLNS